MATLLWLDGFEHGRVVAGVGGIYDTVTATPGIATTPVRTGARSLRIDATGAAESVQYNLAAGNRIVCQAVYFRFATLPTADVRLMEFNNASGNGNVWFVNSTDQIGVAIGGGSIVAGGPTLVVDTWYRLVVEYDTSTGTYSIKAKVDNGTEFSTTSAIAAADQTALRLGTNGAHTYTCFYDDWLISVTDGDYEDIGGWTSHQIEALIPNSDGTHNITTSGDFDSFTGTAFDNTTTTGNTFIGHRPLQVTNIADQVIRQEFGTTTNYMEFGLENLADNTKAVAAVRAYASHIESSGAGASLGEARLLLSDDTEVLTTGSVSVINSTEDPGATSTVRKRMSIAPSGGWDGTKVDGLKARVGFADNAPDVNFIDFMVEVAQYVASGDAVATPATVAAVAAVPAPTAQGAASTSPATVAGVAAVPAPTARSDNTASPATVAGAAAVPAPTVRGAAVSSPTTVVGTAAVPAPTARGAAVTSPSTVAAIGAVPAPVATGSGGGDGTANPATVAAIAAVPAPTVRGAAVASPTTVVGIGAVPAPTARGAARATPNTVAAIAAVPAPDAFSGGPPPDIEEPTIALRLFDPVTVAVRGFDPVTTAATSQDERTVAVQVFDPATTAETSQDERTIAVKQGNERTLALKQ